MASASFKLFNPLFPAPSSPSALKLAREAGCWKNFRLKVASYSSAMHPSKGCEEEVVEYLESLKNYERVGVPPGAGVDSDATGFDLRRMRRLLANLGDPLSKFPVVHVAGTKGKGSTVAFISNILRAAGLSVGTYTSPHISSVRERIVAGNTGSPISAESLHDLFTRARGILDRVIVEESGCLTHFEVLTALAFKYFEEEKVDIAVVETGLGGVRDATNIIQPSGLAAAVIVAIGEEHLEALGGSLESIAFAKAGIIKQGRPVILGRQSEPVAEAIVQKVAVSKRSCMFTTSSNFAQFSFKGYCIEKGVPFQVCDFTTNSKVEGPGTSAKMRIHIPDCKLRMIGPHQLDNATTAILTALCLKSEGWKIDDTAIQSGLECTFLPGRFEITSSAEARALGAPDAQVVLDGAHTAGSAIMLAKTLKSFFEDIPLALVVAMASDKDHLAFASAILSEIRPAVVVTTEVRVAGDHLRSASKSTLLGIWNDAAKRHHVSVSHSSVTLSKIASEKFEDELVHIWNSQGRQPFSSALTSESAIVLGQADSLTEAIKVASELLGQFQNIGKRVICVTGSLHLVSAAKSILSQSAK